MSGHREGLPTWRCWNPAGNASGMQPLCILHDERVRIVARSQARRNAAAWRTAVRVSWRNARSAGARLEQPYRDNHQKQSHDGDRDPLPAAFEPPREDHRDERRGQVQRVRKIASDFDPESFRRAVAESDREDECCDRGR